MRLLVLVFAFLASTASYAQFPSYQITSQEEIDNWTYTEASSVTIQGPDITSLEGLSELHTVVFSLIIRNTFNLTSLNGIENVEIGPNQLRIENNLALTDASAILPYASNSPNNFIIIDNPLLQTIGDFSGFGAENVTIKNNPNLNLQNCFTSEANISLDFEGPTFQGFEGIVEASNIKVVTEDFQGLQSLETANTINYNAIANYPTLTSVQVLEVNEMVQNETLQGFPLLASVDAVEVWTNNGGTFNFSSLSSLTSLGSVSLYTDASISFEGLEDITELYNFVLSFCTGPISFNGLQNLENVFGPLTIDSCSELTSLEGFESLQYVETLTVFENQNLVTCCGWPENLIVGATSIVDNGSDNCDDFETWLSECGFSEGCTNPQACNYDPGANLDDGSCLVSGTPCDDGDPLTEGDEINFDCECAGEAIELIWGCTYPVALNFDSDATIDDGSCLFQECITGDIDGDQLVGVEDLLILLQNFGNQLD